MKDGFEGIMQISMHDGGWIVRCVGGGGVGVHVRVLK